MNSKLRAVYYCRVSTDDENQMTSIANQKDESIKTIKDNRWILIDGYVDEGKSGTTTKKRNEYNRLVQDMEMDIFDIIVIKSQDRLMRNTKEWYLFIDKLVQNHKKLYFYLEKKFYTPDDALITGIKAILAEEYSRSLSKNINNAHRKRQESGSNIIITSKTWGYDKIDKKVVINEKEAKMIQYIYEMANQNYGSRTIAKMLQDQGYYNHEGNKIAEQTVRRIIRNPLYKGTAVMNVYHKDFETKKTERNSQDKWIYHDNIVPPIVSEDDWEKANELMDKRSKAIITEEFKTKIVGSKKNSNLLTGKIQCGLCGNSFWRSTSVSGKTKVYWCCSEYVQRGRKTAGDRTPKGKTVKKYHTENAGCDNIHIREEDLEHLLYEIAKKIYEKSKTDIASIAKKIIEQVINNSDEVRSLDNDLENEKRKIENNRENLLDKYLDGKIADDIYYIKDEKLKNRILEIEEKKKELQNRIKMINEKRERIKEIEKEVEEISNHDLSVENIKRHIEKIVVFQERMELYFDIFDPVYIDVKKVNYRKKEYNICL